MEFKDILHSERIAKGYTLEELGERVGLKKSAIHKYETGLNSNPGRTLILKLAQALDVSPCYLLCGEKEVTITIEEAELLASGSSFVRGILPEELIRKYCPGKAPH